MEKEGSAFMWLWLAYEGSKEKDELKEPRGRLREPEGDGKLGIGGTWNGPGGVVIVHGDEQRLV